MKKILTLLLALVMALALTACGGSGTETAEAEPDATATPNAEEVLAASASDAAALAESEPAASSTDATLNESAYNTALEYVGRTVEELYEAIGEPTETQYAASCLEDGAEDGMLFYEGFYIWSLRTDESETVYQVYLNQ